MMKKKSGKRFLSWLLAAVMIIALMPANAFAEPPTESSGNTETPVTFYCPNSEGGADVSVGGYDSSTTAETLFKDISSDVLSFDADSVEDSLKEGTIQETNTPVCLDKAVVLADDNVPKTQEDLAKEGTEISAVIKTDNDITYLPAEGGNPVSLGGDQSLVILYTPQETPSDADADNRDAETKDTPTEEPAKEPPVADKTTEGAPAQEGAVNSTDEKITEDLTKEASAAELAGLTAMLGAPVLLNLYADASYPVYVYGRFVYGNTTLNDWDKIVNGDTTISGSELYFGEKTTTVSPWNNYPQKVLGEVLPQLAELPLTKSSFSTENDIVANSWEATRNTFYNCWYTEGNIKVYKISYDANGGQKNTLPNAGHRTYYYGTYTIPTTTPSASNNKVFAGWTVNGNTKADGTYYQGGDTIILKDHDKDNTGKITLSAQWKDQKFPVYVYGLFKYKTTTFDKNSKLYINGSTTAISLNKDSFITFGVLNEATTVNPAPYKDKGVISKTTIPTADIEARIKNGDVELSDSAGSAKTNGLLTKSTEISPLVSNWYGLKSCPGATDYVEGDDAVATWHLDGEINLYKVTYKKGNIPNGESFTLPKETTYFLGDYTVQRMETSSQNYKFLGWKYGTELLQDKATIKAPGKDITLTAEWEKKERVYTVNYVWDGSIPADVELPTDSTEYKDKDTALNSYTEHPFTTIDANNGTYTFTGWTENEGTTDYSGDKIVTPITFKGTWTFEAKPITNYNVAYKWAGDIPSDAGNPPTDDKDYASPEAVQAAVNSVDTSSFTSNKPKDNVAGTWTFDKWKESSRSSSTVGHVTTTTITYTGTWKFTPTPVTNYKVAYAWDMDAPTDVSLPDVDNTIYASPADVLAAVNNVDTTNFKSTQPRQGVAGTWTFDKWKESSRSSSTVGHVTTTTITYIGTWKFTPTPVTNYKVAYAWDMDAPTDVSLPDVDNTIYASPADVLAAVNNVDTTNFKSTQPRQGVAGTWTFNTWTEDHRTEAKDGHVTTITITYIGTWTFTPSEIKTITGVLNGLVQKDFKAQYNYSTEGTFTAIAKVMPVHPEINSYAAEVDESSDNNTNTPGTDNAKTFTGTVNLKTGETRAFNFSAGKGVADVLDPDTYYEVRVSEVEGNLSKVTYDTTKYILTFTTDRNAVVDYIWIAKEKDSENDHPELEPVEGTTITFHNIYTYKRHHSSSDGGNGGGKKEEKPTVEIKDDDALGLNNTDHFAYIVGYGNGEVRPQNSITRAEVAAIFFRLLEDDVRDANYTRQNKFTDVSNDAWYCSAVSTLSAMGIISGYPDATFRPNASITRAEFAAIATRFDVNGDKTPASFNDIAGHWAKDEIAVAANNGWVNGYEDGSFRPQNKITRAETMSLVNRVLNRKPETAEDLLENMTKWTDNADTNAWYYLAVQEATNSHYYEYKEKSQYEKWTELRETRDWSELDK